jgi:3-phenylpropionate/trans-cinnamate dioxygenase ferredoxin reductase component
MSSAVQPMQEPRRIVIVGAGHGGGTVAAVLRQQGFDGEVILIGAEPVGPYHRPPLSKSLLKGGLEQPLQPRDFYREQGIELRTGTRVDAIDRQAKTICLGDGEVVPFDLLVLATGAKARRLAISGIDLHKVYELRTITHARILHDVLTPGRHLAIVGGGWIGLEVAASALSAGVEVTVIEREDRLLARVASEELSRHLTDYHTRRGTRILTSTQVTALAPGARRIVKSVILANGREIPCDRVLVGVGAVADDDLARSAGLSCEDGVVVDWSAHTDDPWIYAVGDMTRRPLKLHDGLFRLESIPSAVEQARQAVASILGKPAPAPEVPWFWSDQFDLKLQIAGLVRGADTVTVRADPEANKLAVFHTKDGRLLAVEGVNAPAEFMAGKQMIRDQVELDLTRLADNSVPLDRVALVSEADLAAAQGAEPEVAVPEVAVPEVAAPAAVDGSQAPGPGGKAGEPRVTFIQSDGVINTVDIPAGLTLMDGSVRNNLPGIIAECGGMCSCGTCHVYVDDQWGGLIPEPELEEEDLLEFIDGRESNSRLSCQIVMGDELDGLVVRVPQFSQ